MTTHPWIDSSRGRLHIFSIAGGATPAEGTAFIASFRKLWQSIEQPVGIITDFSNVMDIPPSFRKAAAEVDREMREKQSRFCVAWGVVITSNVQRMIFQGYLWIAPPASPYRVFASREEALLWVRQQLALARVSLRPEDASAGKMLAAARTLAERVQERKGK